MSHRWEKLLLFLLSAISGVVDVISFLTLKIFAAHVTGNLVLIAAALVGWFAVSFVINVVRQQRQPPVILHGESLQGVPAAARVKGPSLREIAATWHTVLRVRNDASVEEIEAAYHRRIAECDAVRYSNSSASDERQEAERQRFTIDEAYNFIRTSRETRSKGAK